MEDRFLPPPPRGKELLPVIGAVAELGTTQIGLLMLLAPLPPQLLNAVMDLDRVALIGKLADGVMDSKERIDTLSEAEITLLVLAGVFGMIRGGASPAEVQQALVQGLSARRAREVVAKAAAGASS